MSRASGPRESLSVLVSGSTGNWGGALARALLRRGQRVRGLTRRIDSPAAQELSHLGAEMVVGDFEDVASLSRAAQGMDTIFAMTTVLREARRRKPGTGST